MTYGIYEEVCLKRLVNELKISVKDSMKMLCDNQASISIAKNPIHHDRINDMKIDHHFIKEKIEEGTITLVYTPTTL